jgi:hypothetical protein
MAERQGTQAVQPAMGPPPSPAGSRALPSRAILNAGVGAWAFEELAARLARALWLDVREEPAAYNYLLGWDGPGAPAGELFIPEASIRLAADKRELARVFEQQGIATPRTELIEAPEAVRQFVIRAGDREWVLKWPTGCGAAGHRLLAPGDPVPEDWPRPYVLQEFIRMERPEVYRLYGAAGELFGWNARRFPAGARPSPWVAHAQGARYAAAGAPPAEAQRQARRALAAAGLLASFGCVDLLPAPAGRWLVLEVGTDGLFNHVDRELALPAIETEIDRRLAQAFWARIGPPPWGSEWRPLGSNLQC